jgi:hypothetical protein
MTTRTEQDRGHSTPTEHPDPPHRRRVSTVALAAAVVLGTLLLLYGLDWTSRWAAETLLQRHIQDSTGVSGAPSVQVDGALFLPQVVTGRYDHVEVTVTSIDSGPLHIRTVHADLRGVHVSFHDLLLRDVSAVWVERSDEQAVLTYDDLNRYLRATGRPLRLARAPGNQIRITGTITAFGKQLSASARVRLGVQGGALSVQPTGLSTDTPLDHASEVLLGQRFTFLVPLDPLPFGQHLTTVHAGNDGIHIAATGTDIVVRP